jgi:hypothetical protein
MMTKNGQAINPLKTKSEPPVPLDAKVLPSFLEHIAPMQAQLAGSTTVQSAAK